MSHGFRPHGAHRTAWASIAAGLLVVGIGVACSVSDQVTGPAGGLRTIVVAPTSVTIPAGGSQSFTATGQNQSGQAISGLTFFWSSSNTSIVTVTQSGQVTAVSPGQAQIAASAAGLSGFATITVSSKPVGSIIVVPSTATLRIATTLELSDTVKDASGTVLQGQTVTWSSDSPSIVSVDGKGLVTARALGTAHIAASSGGKSAVATITVSQVPVRSITISPSAPSVFVTQKTQLTAVTRDSAGNQLSGRIVRWAAANPAVATIDSVTGVLTGVSDGATQISAVSEGITGSVTATVSSAPPSTVVLSPGLSQVHVGQIVHLSAIVTNSTGSVVQNPTVNFSSNNSTIASVTSQTGATAQILAGPTPGTATITGTSAPATGTATIIVSLAGVDSVAISAAHDTLTPGQSETLTATAFDSSGNPLSGRAVTWQSNNTGVATVNTSGGVTAQAPGIAVIFATISGIKGSLALVVNPTPVGSVTISPRTDTISVLGQLQLAATVRDINGNVIHPSQTWYSTNKSIAVVTSSGLVTGLAGGQASIIDSVGGKADTNTTTVIAPVARVTVNPPSATITLTQTQVLTATLEDANGNALTGRPIVWTSSNHAVDTVSQSGVVYPMSPGIDTISASVSQLTGTVSGRAIITVTPVPVASVAVSPPSATITLAQTQTLTALLKDANGNTLTGRTVTWTSSNRAVDTVSQRGIVYPVGPGTDTITASVAQPGGTVSGLSVITVTLVPVASVTVSPLSATITLAQTQTLTALVKDANGNTLTGRIITWASSNRAVDTVSQSGVVYPVSPGTDTITASVTQPGGTVAGRATITVTQVPVASLTLSPPSATITLAQTQTLTPLLKDANGNTLSGRTITWASSNHAVDTVSQTGVVYPVSAGTDTVTASVSQPGGTISGSSVITVTLVPVASVTLSPPSATITLTQTQALTALLKDANGNTLTGRPITWASSNHAVDTVSQSGVVYPVSAGTDTITASVSQPGGTVSGLSVITVTPVPVASVTVSPPSATITLAQTQALTALLKDVNGNPLTGRTIAWASSNHAVDTVSQSGIVYPVSPGTDTITASVSQPGGTISGSSVVTVTQVPVASVVVYPTSNTIFATAPGNSVQLQDSTKDASGNNLPGRPVTWTPASGGVATVNPSGLVTATDSAAGTATITATSTDGPSGSAVVAAIGHAQSVGINFFDTSHPDTLSAGATPGYDPSDAGTATVLDTFNTDVSGSRLVSWTTSDPTSLLINGQASVANSVAGTPVTLSAVSNAGLPATVTVTVTTTDGGTVNVTHSLPITILP